MSGPSNIEWTDSTWNPTRGCSRVSAGCVNCYAEGIAARFSGTDDRGNLQPYHGLAEHVVRNGRKEPRWTGELRLVESTLTAPLSWRKPRKIFVNSMSDLFHEKVPDEWIDRIFAVMALSPQHTFQILTKRPERMQGYVSQGGASRFEPIWRAQFEVRPAIGYPAYDWPLPNVWLGTSVEDQATYDERKEHLRNTPAAVHFFSMEPLLGPIVADYLGDWVIAGGESGKHARPAHPDWFCKVRDDCAAAGVAFFFKQWGTWHPCEMKDGVCYPMPGHAPFNSWKAPIFDTDIEEGWNWRRLDKHRSGRTLDGREHSAFPSTAPSTAVAA